MRNIKRTQSQLKFANADRYLNVESNGGGCALIGRVERRLSGRRRVRSVRACNRMRKSIWWDIVSADIIMFT